MRSEARNFITTSERFEKRRTTGGTLNFIEGYYLCQIAGLETCHRDTGKDRKIKNPGYRI
jgi:hypothetical protein